MYKVIIGLEIHVQLDLNTKLFCRCSTSFGDSPNSNTCINCQAYPGALPLLNKSAIHKAIFACQYLNCNINNISQFDRKHYMYPDLASGYQLTQFYKPIGNKGYIYLPNAKKKVAIDKVIIEEDAGKLIHSSNSSGLDNHSYVDYNRLGSALLEIVSEPDIRNEDEAYEFLNILKRNLKYLSVSDCNMEEGSLRCDVNISLVPEDSSDILSGTRQEIKNLNSFRNIKKAIQYEVKRQKNILKSGQTLELQTLLYDIDKNITYPMRSKETVSEYRYLMDYNLPRVSLSDSYINRVIDEMPELLNSKKERIIKRDSITIDTVDSLFLKDDAIKLYEDCIKIYNKNPIKLSNLIITYLYGLEKTLNIDNICNLIKPSDLSLVVESLDKKLINNSLAKKLLIDKINDSSISIIDEIKSSQTSKVSGDALTNLIKVILDSNPEFLESYKKGKVKIVDVIFGKIMRETKGNVDTSTLKQFISDNLKQYL